MLSDRLNLFSRAAGGCTAYRIPGVCVARGGTALAHAEARFGRGGRWDKIDMLMRRSAYSGLNWEAARLLAAVKR